MVAAVPAVAGWLLHVTPASSQDPAPCRASRVRPSLADAASMCSLAEAMPEQPAGSGGSGKRTSARALLPLCEPLWDLIFSVESLPKLFDGLPWLTQVSWSAGMLCGFVGQSPGWG